MSLLGGAFSRTWRRLPSGMGMRALDQRYHEGGGQMPGRPAVVHMEPDDYAAQLRSEGCSEDMIEREVEQLMLLQQQHGRSKKELELRRQSKRMRPVDDSLQEYVEAEIRRTAGPSADEIIDELYGPDSS